MTTETDNTAAPESGAGADADTLLDGNTDTVVEETGGEQITTTEGDDTLLGGEPSTESEGDEGSANSDADDSDGSDTGAKDGEGDNGAPESYDEFTLPEGVELKGEALEKATTMFKELGLSQEQAQKLVDYQADTIATAQQAQDAAYQTLMKEWRTAAENDSEIGGEKFKQNLAVANKALAEFGSPELKSLLRDHGVGNNPEMIRFMYKIGTKLTEDVPDHQGKPRGGKPQSTQEKRADSMYGNNDKEG